MLHECEKQLAGLKAEDITEIKFTKEFTHLPHLTNIEFVVDTEEHGYAPSTPHWIYTFDFGEITVYDETHFRYKGQNYVVVGDINIDLIYP